MHVSWDKIKVRPCYWKQSITITNHNTCKSNSHLIAKLFAELHNDVTTQFLPTISHATWYVHDIFVFRFVVVTWWRHQMETFSALLAICAWNSPVSGEFPAQRPVTRGFDIFFDLRLNKRLSKQSWGWWFETLSCPLWRQCNVYHHILVDSCDRYIHMLQSYFKCQWSNPGG